jgi:hypothetical protein
LNVSLNAPDLSFQCGEVLCRREALLIATEPGEEEPLIDEFVHLRSLVCDRLDVRELLLEEPLLPCDLGLERLAV